MTFLKKKNPFFFLTDQKGLQGNITALYILIFKHSLLSLLFQREIKILNI